MDAALEREMPRLLDLANATRDYGDVRRRLAKARAAYCCERAGATDAAGAPESADQVAMYRDFGVLTRGFLS